MNKTEQIYYPDDLITAYLNNELNKEQRVELEQWVAADTAHKQYFYEMTEVWLAANAASGTQEESNRAFQHFRGRIFVSQKKKRFSLRFVRVAVAIFAGILLLGGGYYWGHNHFDPSSLYAMQTVEVPIGSRSRIVLQDGTVVWLNAGSKLSYTSGFSHQDRHVRLEGEGYFEVTRNEKLPFIVNTSDLDVKVLGTKFSVKAYTDEENIEVILAEGSVNLLNIKNPDESLIMKPEQQVIYNKETGTTDIHKVPASLAGHWTTGAHFFNEQTLEQIVRELEKSFDVTFIFRNEEKKKLTFYGDFRVDDSLDDILMIMSSSGKFKYRKTNNIIELY